VKASPIYNKTVIVSRRYLLGVFGLGAFFGGCVVVSLLAIPTKADTTLTQSVVEVVVPPSPEELRRKKTEKVQNLLRDKYNVPSIPAAQYADLLVFHGDPVFPTTTDLLAIMAIESRFDPNAKSHVDARGLMQVLKGSYALHDNIPQGTDILKQYYGMVKNNKDDAVTAYNVGIGDFKRGVRNPNYLRKFKEERSKIDRYLSS